MGYSLRIMVAQKLAILALALFALGCLSQVSADAETARLRCFSRDQQRIAIAERRAIALAAVRTKLRTRVPGDVVRARLCQESERLIYQLTVLPRDGRVRRVNVDAKSGAVLQVH